MQPRDFSFTPPPSSTHLPTPRARAYVYCDLRPTNKPITWPFNLSSRQFPSNPADNFDVPTSRLVDPRILPFAAYFYSLLLLFFLY